LENLAGLEIVALINILLLISNFGSIILRKAEEEGKNQKEKRDGHREVSDTKYEAIT